MSGANYESLRFNLKNLNLENKTQKIRELGRNWKFLDFRKFLYLPKILTSAEKRFFILALMVVLLTGISFFTRIFFKITHPVPEIGGSYNEGLLREPRIINPLYASQDTDRDLIKIIFAGLLTYDGNGLIQPDLAEKYEISPDGKIYTVYLKEDIQWHDGEPLTAEDVIFTVKTIQNPLYKSVLRANWLGVTTEKVNDRTIKFFLRTPYTPFVENLTVGIIPKHLWENIAPGQALLHELNLRPVGAGPYKFYSLKQAKDGSIQWYQVERNANYHSTGPFLKRITLYFFKSEDEIIAALHKGAIDGFGPISVSRVDEFDSQKTKIMSVAMPRIFGIFFNEKQNKNLSVKKIKEAIAYAIDRNEISQKTTSGGAIPLSAPLPLLNLETSFEKPYYPYNPQKARNTLGELGWKDLDGDGILEKAKTPKATETEKLSFKLFTSDWPDLLRAAELIKNQLSQIGVAVEVIQKPLTELESSVIRPRDFDMLLFGQVYGYELDPYIFWHSSQIKDPGLNISMYVNKKADRLLEEARKIPDLKEREEKYKDFVKILNEDLPAVFLYSQLYLYLLPDYTQGVNLNRISLPSDRFNTINQWYEGTDRVLNLFNP